MGGAGRQRKGAQFLPHPRVVDEDAHSGEDEDAYRVQHNERRVPARNELVPWGRAHAIGVQLCLAGGVRVRGEEIRAASRAVLCGQNHRGGIRRG